MRSLGVITGAAAAVSVCVLAPPALGQTSSSCPSFAPETLPEARMGSPYSVKLFSGPGYLRLLSEPGVTAGLLVVDSSRWHGNGAVLAGTPGIPGNTGARIKVSTTSACPGFTQVGPTAWEITKDFDLKVRDTQAPVLENNSGLRSLSLPTNGGSYGIMVWAGDNFCVSRAVVTTTHPDGHTGSAFLKQTLGPICTGAGVGLAPPALVHSRWQLEIPIPANTGDAPAVWRFALALYDPDGNSLKPEPATVTVAAHAAGPLPAPPPKLPGH